MQDGLAYLVRAVELHEGPGQGDSTATVVGQPGAAPGAVQTKLPVTDAVLLHEAAGQGEDVRDLHGPERSGQGRHQDRVPGADGGRQGDAAGRGRGVGWGGIRVGGS